VTTTYGALAGFAGENVKRKLRARRATRASSEAEVEVSGNRINELQPAPPSLEAFDSAKKLTCEELVQDNILWRIEDPENSASKHSAEEPRRPLRMHD
jgi:hypothetical protein